MIFFIIEFNFLEAFVREENMRSEDLNFPKLTRTQFQIPVFSIFRPVDSLKNSTKV